MNGTNVDLTLELNLVENLLKSDWESDKDKDLKKIFWTSSNTNPIPNSTADKTKKKKVKDKRFKLSYDNPTAKVKKYKVIHNISAVSNKCKAELTFIQTEDSIITKTIIKMLISPKYIIYKLRQKCV